MSEASLCIDWKQAQVQEVRNVIYSENHLLLHSLTFGLAWPPFCTLTSLTRFRPPPKKSRIFHTESS